MTAAFDPTVQFPHLSAPWPDTAEAVAANCTAAIDLLWDCPDNQSTRQALSVLSDTQWWVLWAHACVGGVSDDARMPASLSRHVADRRQRMYSDPRQLDALMASPSLMGPDVLGDVVLKAATEGANPWLVHTPSDMIAFVRHLFNTCQQRGAGVRDMWQCLLRARVQSDTPELEQATRDLWALLPNPTHRPQAWVQMVVTLGHTPHKLEGFMGMTADPVISAAALSAIATQPQHKPVHLDVIDAVARHQPAPHLAAFLEKMLRQHHATAWTLTAVDHFWAKAGLDQPSRSPSDHPSTTNESNYVSILLSLAARGLPDECTKRMTQHPPMSMPEAHIMAAELRRRPNDSTELILHALMEHSPPQERTALMRAFCARPNRASDPVHYDTLVRAIVGAWGLVPAPTAMELIDENSFLADIPELAAWRQRMVLNGVVAEPTTTRAIRM